MTKIGIVGAGHLGKIHIKLLKMLEEEGKLSLLGFFDIDKNVVETVSKQFNLKAYRSFEAMLTEVDAIDIVCPTTVHFQYAEKALYAGKHIFLEKPACTTSEEVRELLSINKSANKKIQVGHVERFNPAFLAIENEDIEANYFSIARLAPYNVRGTDVSVVMDLMIHDLDILLKLKPEKIIEIEASGVATVSETTDHANVCLKFADGSIAHLEASRVAKSTERKAIVFEENENFYTLDFFEKTASKSIKVNTPEKLQVAKLKTPEVNAIKMELDLFITAIANNTQETVSLQEALKVIETAEQIEELIKEQQSTISNVIA